MCIVINNVVDVNKNGNEFFKMFNNTLEV